jgi:hypothetical protein
LFFAYRFLQFIPPKRRFRKFGRQSKLKNKILQASHSSYPSFPKSKIVMKNLMLTLLLLCFALFSNPKAQVQVIKGTVLDKQAETPLFGATIELVGETVTGTTTDIDGNFRLEEVAIGRRALKVSYIGYESVTLPNVMVTAGKEVILRIGLEESIEQLQEVVVRASESVGKDKAQNEMATISARTFSMEEVNRFFRRSK